MCINPSDSGEAATPPHFFIPGWDVVGYATLDSTNLEAKRRIAQGYAEKSLILAESQTNGQCRHDRLWISPPDAGIWASFILPVSVPREALPQSTLVLAVAVQEGISKATGISLKIKWPNDLLGNRKKCCGLLVEADPEKASPASVPLILGVGINCNQTEEAFPPDLREIATSLSILASGQVHPREHILRAVADSIEHWFGIWQKQGFAPVRNAWITHSGTLGNAVILPEGYGQPHGLAHGLDPSGALLVLAENGEEIRIESGEILFPASGLRGSALHSVRL